MAEYKITGRSQLNHLRPLIGFTLACYIILKAGVYLWGQDAFETGLVSLGAWYLVLNFIPQSILHVRYLILNYKMELQIDSSGLNMKLKTRKYSNSFSVNDIKGIVYYRKVQKSSFFMLPWDSYAYMTIYLKNGDRYVITSLMAKNLKIDVDDNTKFDAFFPYPVKGQRFISHSLSGTN